MTLTILRRSAMALAFAAPLAAQTDGRAVLQRMHDAYAGKWYSNLRFVQKTTQIRPDGQRIIATWFESLRHTPDGRTQLRIDVGDPANGNGIFYTADSSWVVRGGKVAATRPEGNEFLPMIEGVYMQPVDVTMKQIAGTHVDMSKVTRGTWEGRAATIIGISAVADTAAPQIWVDDERNVVVRMILAPTPSSPPMDIHLGDYVKVADGWLATKVSMSVGGKPVQIEDYADWKAGSSILSNDLFDVNAWAVRSHWASR
jgi:hypothetical protein